MPRTSLSSFVFIAAVATRGCDMSDSFQTAPRPAVEPAWAAPRHIHRGRAETSTSVPDNRQAPPRCILRTREGWRPRVARAQPNHRLHRPSAVNDAPRGVRAHRARRRTTRRRVTKATNVLVVGEQDIARLALGQTLSGKHRKAAAIAPRRTRHPDRQRARVPPNGLTAPVSRCVKVRYRVSRALLLCAVAVA